MTRPVYESVAIIGIGCHFPGNVDNPQSFWNLLCAQVDATGEFPEDRWNINAFYNENKGHGS